VFVHQVAVVGAGTLGAEIAQAVAAAGLPVVLDDADEARNAAALDHIRRITGRRLEGLVDRGRLSRDEAADELDAVAARVTPVAGHAGLGHADLVVVTEPEDTDALHALFGELDGACAGHAVLASAATSVAVGDAASATARPERVVGLHFFAPAATVRAVEVVEAEDTAEETVQAAVDFCTRIGKQPLRCLDGPGFAVVRVLGALLSEAWRAEHEGMDAAEIDARVEAAGLLPAGPFRLAEHVGPGSLLRTGEHLRDALGQRFYVSPAIERLARDAQ
jgi:3-hydroxybutyryl-CoA dehydrogenase